MSKVAFSMDIQTWMRVRPFVRRWQNMMDRCYDTNCPAFRNYGGRGIKVCDAWHDPYVYVEQLPKGYFEGAHLDRIDNDGHYEPGNVRWVTPKQNHQNRRTSVMIEFNGKTQNLSMWAQEVGINPGTLHTRLQIKGWSVERALTEKVMGPHERMRLARNARLSEMRKQRGLPEDGPYITKKSLIPKRIERRVEYNGALYTIRQLSEVTGISSKKLRKRILERGWAVERAVEAG